MLAVAQPLSIEEIPSIADRWADVVGPVIIGGHRAFAIGPQGLVPTVSAGSNTPIIHPSGALDDAGFDGWARSYASGSANLIRAQIPNSTLGQDGVTGGFLHVFSTTSTASLATLSGLGADSGSTGNTSTIFSTGSTTSDLYVTFGGSSNNRANNYAGAKINDGGLHAVLLLGTWNTSTGTAEAWLDGKYLGSYTAGNTGTANTFSWICAGSWRRSSDRSTGATHSVALATPIMRRLSIQEGCDLTCNPWQVLDYNSGISFLAFYTISSTTFQSSWASQANTIVSQGVTNAP